MSHLIVYLLFFFPLRHIKLFPFQANNTVNCSGGTAYKKHQISLSIAEGIHSSNTRTKGVADQWDVKQGFFPSIKSVLQESSEKDTWFCPKEVTVVILPKQNFTYNKQGRSTQR